MTARTDRQPPMGEEPPARKRRHRPLRWKERWPDLEEQQILAWADAHHARTGEWPNQESGPVVEAPRERWGALDQDLRLGLRGLRRGSSLARLLAEHRGVRNGKALPKLCEAQILAWADAHRARTGRWPGHDAGPIPEAPGESWSAVEAALYRGVRGLPGGSSLAKLLVAQRQARVQKNLPALTEAQILAWADAHHRRTGQWPAHNSGPIAAAPAETWLAVGRALRRGDRGLPPGSSLARLLAAARGVRNPAALAPFSLSETLAWADAYRARTGRWPTGRSGLIEEASGETWQAVDGALQEGCRGQPGGSSLARLLAEHRGVRNQRALPALSPDQILAWAGAHHARHGGWPKARSGPVEAAPGETWERIDNALSRGRRGLPAGSSLFRLIREHREG